MKPHVIRLAGPWEWKWKVQESNSDPDSALRQPCQLPFDLPTPPSEQAAPCSAAVLYRRFHCPTGIGEGTSVCLVVEVSNAQVTMTLNQQVIPLHYADTVPTAVISDATQKQGKQLKSDITRILKPFNELQVQLIASAEEVAARVLSVCLTIYERA